jgi:hypothetical protein
MLRPMQVTPAPESSPVAERSALGVQLPSDGPGAFLPSWWATTLRIWKQPYQVFSQLADGPVLRAWAFGLSWAVVFSLLRSLLLQERIMRVSFYLFVAIALQVGFLLLEATLWFLAVRLLSARRAPWSLALRAKAYAGAWLWPIPFITAAVRYLPHVDEFYWPLGCLSLAVSNLVPALAFFALGRGRLELSGGKALGLGLLAVTPSILLGLGLLIAEG